MTRDELIALVRDTERRLCECVNGLTELSDTVRAGDLDTAHRRIVGLTSQILDIDLA